MQGIGRTNSTMAPTRSEAAPQIVEKTGTLFVDSIFPIQLGIWDIRHFFARHRKDQIMASLQATMDQIHTSGFRVEKIEPRMKDGGAFVKFKYTELTQAEGSDVPLEETPSLEAEIKKRVHEIGGIETWMGNKGGDVWLVRGKPWKEDMRRYAANTVKVYFEGPDIYQETLYALMRPYGQVADITNPVPVPAGTLRFSTVQFSSPRSATRAHNCVHGFTLVDDPAIAGQSSSGKPTRLATVYERKLKWQSAKDWIGGHPRIVGPIVLFLIGTLSYVIFDPIRTIAVQAKVMEWLDYKEFRVIKWLRHNTLDRIPFFRKQDSKSGSPASTGASESLWQDRKEAEHALRSYLHEIPSTIAFVHGPQGSGKTSMLNRALKNANRRTLVIDCEPLNKARSDADVINGLAQQTGYWPVFTWLNNFTNLLDLASVGLIGQKTGLASSVETQLKEILEVVGNALKGVSARHKEIERTKELARNLTEHAEKKKSDVADKTTEVMSHDGRVDALAGSGIIGELGVGDERMTEKDQDGKVKSSSTIRNTIDKAKAVLGANKEAVQKESEATDEPGSDTSKTGWKGNPVTAVQGVVQEVVKDTKQGAEKLLTVTKDQLGLSKQESESSQSERTYKERTEIDEEIQALPVVVIKNFASKTSLTDELVNVLAEWAAGLADGGVAHVVVMSDNRDNGRRLEKALPTKPLTSIALNDADPASALSFVQDKLRQYGVSSALTKDQMLQIDRLGGRSSDLEALCHKVKNGMPVEMAVEDIITRGVGELRKSAFGEIEDAGSMAWSREQVFFILKSLAKSDELPYYDVLVDFPFKGDEAALRSMEHSELISITTQDGRPSTIRPGKPVYRYVFQKLVNDTIFRSIQDIALNEKAIASAESTIRKCEEELLTLEKIKPLDSGVFSSGATRQRANFLLQKLHEAETKIEKLEASNATLKKNLKLP